MNGKSGTAIRLVDCAKTFPNGTRALDKTSLEMRSASSTGTAPGLPLAATADLA